MSQHTFFEGTIIFCAVFSHKKMTNCICFHFVPMPSLRMKEKFILAFADLKFKSQKEDSSLLAVSSISLRFPLRATFDRKVYIKGTSTKFENQHVSHRGKPEQGVSQLTFVTCVGQPTTYRVILEEYFFSL